MGGTVSTTGKRSRNRNQDRKHERDRSRVWQQEGEEQEPELLAADLLNFRGVLGQVAHHDAEVGRREHLVVVHRLVLLGLATKHEPVADEHLYIYGPYSYGP